MRITDTVKHDIRSKARFLRIGGTLMLAAVAAGALAQTVPDQAVPDTGGLNIPSNLQLFGKLDPNIRKPTAIVNDTVLTGTDLDQRMALALALNNVTNLSAEDRDRLRMQILRQLIDETLQIQEAKTADITVTPDEINQAYARFSQQFGKTPSQMNAFLRQVGSSEKSMRRQIEGELAWSRYLRRKVEPTVNVGDEEVNAIRARLEAAKGTEEYNLKEIFLSANEATAQQVFANARQIIAEIQKGQQPFEYFARSFSEASTRAVNGDLGWVRSAQLPPELQAAVGQMQVGQVAGPIQIPGGFSILYLTDKRQVLTADPRDSRLSLKQLTVKFPAGTTQAQASARAAEFAKATQAIRGCGDVQRVATQLKAEVVDNDQVTIRQLPAPLQEILLKLQIGQATPPFGSPEQGVRSLVLCDREEPRSGNLPTNDQLQNQLEQQRVNLRANQKMRDLRRDAVIEYR
ncbi:peptidyl-prolyl cis-trans isomerase SurA [Sphingomonas sp. SORGH_AS 950]|uniref:peptidylprolyl isomerase n=1 Tax=unclassified Sphingomonas TaxID=196159 RepID=UPI0027833A9D|nr:MULTISPECIES: peptidylprolyl isomerase [unclassified Sphingomonas]MDQ1156394.1 peptidyl-prolyl cis-trans isomerase SurA [Sphingomonas sp. SORGH_AS_0950]MDR6115730.1 peptidyl-prolyl cis-trans isomerase SurA [Sphingomonas sp. SORGH_AS_0789]MDR6146803.1 peptidyl-prolyl cis-trans isomerase SurA [Sphingomonas sp. SORGH_AS_0870]MDR6150599.1 peptidyl-prolyl cis-trans isomerase SurA [Sphingomonas sp. SORGH_AS_0742]